MTVSRFFLALVKPLLGALLLLSMAGLTHAHISRYWLDEPEDGVWHNPNNWVDGEVPSGLLVGARFDFSTVTAVQLEAEATVERLTFFAAPDYTFSGQIIHLTVGENPPLSIVISSPPAGTAQTFNNLVTFTSASALFPTAMLLVSNGGTLVFNSGLTTTALNLDHSLVGSVYINGAVPANIDGAFLVAGGAALGGTGVINAVAGVSVAGALRAGGRVGDTTADLTINAALSMAAGSVLEFGIGGTAAGEFDRVIGVTTFTANGTVVLTAADGFATTALSGGASFDFIDWSGAALANGVAFDVSAAPLTAGLAWDFSSFAATGTVKVVSEFPNEAIGGTATASAEAGGQPASSAFDGSSATSWASSATGGTGILAYEFGGGAAHVIREYRITSGDESLRDPKSWQFQGSNDGIVWTTLGTVTAQTFATRGLTKHFTVPNATAYTHYRLNITAVSGGAAFSLQIAEFGLFIPPTPPAAPAGLTATPGQAQVTLGWTAVESALSYTVKRSEITGGPYPTTVASGLASTGFTDTGLTNGQTYHYVVFAENSAGLSPASSQASATPIGPAQLTPPQISISGATVVLLMKTVSGRTYQLQRSDLLQPASWTDLGASQAGTGGWLEFNDVFDTELPLRFYRLDVRP